MNLHTLKYIFISMVVGIIVYSCANRGSGPTGGPKDTTPPKVMKSTPKNGTLNFKKKQVEIDFNEMVSIVKPNENVIISPPQIKLADVKSYGKKVVVNLNDDLIDSTTYTINFGSGIVDLNENNPVKNYVFSFSTGNQIDTLKISGTVINADDMNPQAGIYVGIYKEMSDSAFFQKPFLRIGKTDENGRFTISNVKKGKYKVFALNDANHDFFFQPGEALAMCDSLITPDTRIVEMQDTIWKDTTTIDSIRKYMGTRFFPNNLTLRLFKENKKRQYFVKYERKEPFVFSLFFNTTAEKLPVLKPLNFNWEGKYNIQKNNSLDSLTYWITDSLVWKKDTLQLTMTYQKTDSLFQLKPVTDTLNISMRKAKINPRAKTKLTHPKLEPLKFTTNITSTFDVYNPIFLNFEAPLSVVDLTKISLYQKVDTVYKKLQYKWQQLDSTKLSYSLRYKWIPEKSYQLRIDSATFISLYNKSTNKTLSDFKIRSLDEYSNIKIMLANYNSKAIIQVLDTKDNIVASKPALIKGTSFDYLRPGDYYLRMYIDENENGKWDTGELSSRKQPEEVFYYPKKMTLKANWDFEQTWDYKQIPSLLQKPAELIKASAKKVQN